MIAYIRGALIDSWDKTCIILTSGGTGYEVALPAHTYSQLPDIGQEVSFFTSLVVREDAMELFGFSTAEEKKTFEILTAISRIGSRTALAILSTFRPDDLRRVVADADAAALTKVNGIGQKTAQHILLELKYKLGAPARSIGISAFSDCKSAVFGDVLAALLNLGYQEAECAPYIKEILKAEPDLDVAYAIRLTLKTLAKSKE